MTKAGTEYVRGIRVVKDFPADGSFQGVQRSHRTLQQQGRILSGQSVPGAAVCQSDLYGGCLCFPGSSRFVPCPTGRKGDFAGLSQFFVFYAVFSAAIISTALARIMFVFRRKISVAHTAGAHRSGDGRPGFSVAHPDPDDRGRVQGSKLHL